MVLHWVDYYHCVSEVSRDDAASVVPGVLGPHDVHLIISQVTQLQKKKNTKQTNQEPGEYTEF